jgi:hypothetical protein
MRIVTQLRGRLFRMDRAASTRMLRDNPRLTRDAAAALAGAVDAFAAGYNAAVEDPDPAAIGRALRVIAPERRGFAFEGAAMATGLFDLLSVTNDRRFERLARAYPEHCYLIHAGLGWAAARIPWSLARPLAKSDAFLRSLVIDGYGFHHGYFAAREYVGAARLAPLAADVRPAFDQGLGRSLWFVAGADAGELARTIGGFASDRRRDQWSGAGLAAAYAGGCDTAAIDALIAHAGVSRAALAQGVAFAAAARARAANPAPHTSECCERIWRLPLRVVIDLVEGMHAGLDPAAPGAYQTWRGQVQTAFASRVLSWNHIA